MSCVKQNNGAKWCRRAKISIRDLQVSVSHYNVRATLRLSDGTFERCVVREERNHAPQERRDNRVAIIGVGAR
jgi:hypothetical protein